jgi:IMP cyclohydrolase
MPTDIAEANLRDRLAANSCPGRGIVAGRGESGQWIQVYWIMGRSQNSRNRVFVREGDTLRTQAADPSKVGDPSLIICNAMRRLDQLHIVSNGAQTDGIHATLAQGGSFTGALAQWDHEPDAPNFTPRISSLLDTAKGEIWMSVIKAGAFGAPACEQHFYRYRQIDPGYGYAVTTCTGDGSPLPAFAGTPYLAPLNGDAAAIAAQYWGALDAGNRVSLGGRAVDPGSGATHTEVINQYETL